ncbi:MAG: lytic transglycosylase catalytic [uncultured bacterium]|nr:MAG: lytic transglycosylase catalytic [uncultured bacterium]HLD45365.1 lytic transglycosylase domain-containing protein [bacterium]
MKIVFRPLDQIEKLSNKPSSKARGQFDQMLGKHLDSARHAQALPQSNLPPDQQRGVGERDWDFSENIEQLKDVDSEYYQKGVKKKTLAESFSARNDSKLEERIKKFQPIIEAKAKKYDLDPKLLAGLIRQESNFNPYAVSHCGAMGLGQLMPETARYLGVTDPFNAAQNLDGAAKYLKEQLNTFGGSVDKALAAYNAGPGAVQKYNGIPPYAETQNYVRSIRSHTKQIAMMDIFPSEEPKKKA